MSSDWLNISILFKTISCKGITTLPDARSIDVQLFNTIN